MNKEQFITKAIETHCNNCDYSLVEYINLNTTVKIICSLHGIFEQKPIMHLRGHGCDKCSAKSYKSNTTPLKL